MKKLILGVVLSLISGLMIPLTVSASTDDEVTIRVMEAAEDSPQAVMQRIQLPESTSDKVATKTETKTQDQLKLQNRERSRVRENEDNLANEEMEKERERAMEEMRNEAQLSHDENAEGNEPEIENRLQQGGK